MLQNNKKIFVFLFVFFLSINCFATQNLATLYETDDQELNIHLTTKIKSFSEDIDDKKYPKIISRNKLKVGLYAYNINENKWFFFENPFIYTSGWLTKDALPNETYKSLASFYDKKTDKQKLLKNLQDRKAKISNQIGNEILPASFGNFIHSEQAFISDLQNGNGDIEIKKYNRFFILFVSTNEACNICDPILTDLLNNDEYFLNRILKNFPYKEEIEEIRTTKKYENESKTSINIFFESLFPETINKINFEADDRKFLSHHSVLSVKNKTSPLKLLEEKKGFFQNEDSKDEIKIYNLEKINAQKQTKSMSNIQISSKLNKSEEESESSEEREESDKKKSKDKPRRETKKELKKQEFKVNKGQKYKKGTKKLGEEKGNKNN